MARNSEAGASQEEKGKMDALCSDGEMGGKEQEQEKERGETTSSSHRIDSRGRAQSNSSRTGKEGLAIRQLVVVYKYTPTLLNPCMNLGRAHYRYVRIRII